ncbi:MAG: hypothetical protein JW811_01615 [Clostridiales bacterium]|nr:hypothetical protein [Clostridiales bacterium]
MQGNGNQGPYSQEEWIRNMTPEQYAQWRAQNGYPPVQPNQNMPGPPMTNEQWAAMQAAQLGMSRQEMMEWQAMQQAKAELARKKERKLRRQVKRQNRSPLVRILQAMLVVGLLGGVAWLVINGMQEPKPTTAIVETASLGTTHAGDALIVRNETVYNDEGVQNIEYIAREGSSVKLGDVVCYVFSTGYSSKEMTTLQDYRDQIKDYQQSLLTSETAYDQKMTRLNDQVIQRGLEVRELVHGARGSMVNQEAILQEAIDERQAYFRSKYSSDMRLSRLYDDEETQKTRIDSWIKQRAATRESIISFYTDGYESALTPQTYLNYSPAEVRAMVGGQKPERDIAERGKTDIYRLVRKDNYAVLMLIRDSVWTPVEGSVYKLTLENFSTTTVNAQVISYTRSSGELLLRLGIAGDVTPVLYMRTCRAELSEYVDSLVVPRAAIYTQNNQKGVVRVLEDGSLVFIPVTIISEQSDGVYVAPIQTGALVSGQTIRLFH